MPFVSKAQAKACYARQRRNPNDKSWDCEEWAKGTDWKHLPERASSAKKSGSKKKSSKKSSSSSPIRNKKSSPRKPRTKRMNKKSGKKPN